MLRRLWSDRINVRYILLNSNDLYLIGPWDIILLKYLGRNVLRLLVGCGNKLHCGIIVFYKAFLCHITFSPSLKVRQ